VEHRHDRQDRVARRQVQRVGQRRCVCVEYRRAVRVQRALRIAGSSGRIAKARRGTLVEGRPFEAIVLSGKKFLVAEQVRNFLLRHVRPIGHRDEALDGLQPRGELLDQRRERDVEEDVRILGVVRDVGDLIRKEPWIDRMDDRSDAGDCVVDLEVPVAVPGERRDTIVHLDAERLQRFCELPGALVRVPIRVPVHAAFDGLRHDFGRTVMAIGVTDQVRDQKGLFLHQSKHGGLLRRCIR
jgi:hypothetical protein